MTNKANALVDDIIAATDALASAVESEQALEDNRINVKLAAIERIMAAGDNQFTGKPHSFSSAEGVVNTDGEYQAYLERQRAAVKERIFAKGRYDAAVAAARLGATSVV